MSFPSRGIEKTTSFLRGRLKCWLYTHYRNDYYFGTFGVLQHSHPPTSPSHRGTDGRHLHANTIWSVRCSSWMLEMLPDNLREYGHHFQNAIYVLSITLRNTHVQARSCSAGAANGRLHVYDHLAKIIAHRRHYRACVKGTEMARDTRCLC